MLGQDTHLSRRVISIHSTHLPQYDKSKDKDSFAEPKHLQGLWTVVCSYSTIDTSKKLHYAAVKDIDVEMIHKSLNSGIQKASNHIIPNEAAVRWHS